MHSGEEDSTTVFGREDYSNPMSYDRQDCYSACVSDAPYSLGREPTTYGDAQDHHLTAHDDPAYRSSYASCETSWGMASGMDSFPPGGSSSVTADFQQQPALAGSRRQRKPKLYDLPKQDDPTEEMRRQRAIRQKDKREKRYQDEVNMRQETVRAREESRKMKIEKELRGCNIKMMEHLLAMSESAMYQMQPDEMREPDPHGQYQQQG
ncbi:uncharacterized protein LOC125036120 [Penaeus chinensis]|uniref:uncharacterized protein LOC125036120 n=1 Tax=Penaeus chinensis TaxID=139456 RepID=UPI001FB5B473|nr:uncharacterized protein LOC125036120 [Penaeus chinensis]